MGVQVIPIPTEVVSHSLPFPFQILCFIPIPVGFPVPLGIPFPYTSLAYTCRASLDFFLNITQCIQGSDEIYFLPNVKYLYSTSVDWLKWSPTQDSGSTIFSVLVLISRSRFPSSLDQHSWSFDQNGKQMTLRHNLAFLVVSFSYLEYSITPRFYVKMRRHSEMRRNIKNFDNSDVKRDSAIRDQDEN